MTAKVKKMTAREKKERAEAREWLREKGVLPPKKKPLNRKKFCEEAREILGAEGGMEFDIYIRWALCEVMERREWPEGTLSAEAVGAAKVVRLAKARMDFEAAKREAGAERYTFGELMAAVEDIYKA